MTDLHGYVKRLNAEDAEVTQRSAEEREHHKEKKKTPFAYEIVALKLRFPLRTSALKWMLSNSSGALCVKAVCEIAGALLLVPSAASAQLMVSRNVWLLTQTASG